MPSQCGEDVCQIIRKDSLGGHGLMVIAYTAHALPHEIDSFLANGFDAVLIKPKSRSRVMELLTSLSFR